MVAKRPTPAANVAGCKGNPDCNVTPVSCEYGCNTNSCGVCTSCKTNPDCNVTSLTCQYGCKTTNSCGKCTACYSDNCRNRTQTFCFASSGGCESYYADCSSKCEKCKTCTYSEECLNYTLSSGSSCSNGSLSCSACGITKYRCKPSLVVPDDGGGSSCNGTWTNCNGMKCCCRSGESCSGTGRRCLCLAY